MKQNTAYLEKEAHEIVRLMKVAEGARLCNDIPERREAMVEIKRLALSVSRKAGVVIRNTNMWAKK